MSRIYGSPLIKVALPVGQTIHSGETPQYSQLLSIAIVQLRLHCPRDDQELLSVIGELQVMYLSPELKGLDSDLQVIVEDVRSKYPQAPKF